MKKITLGSILGAFLAFSGCASSSNQALTPIKDEPRLTFTSKSKSISLTRTELLSSRALEKIWVDDPAFKNKKMMYEAIPLWVLMKDFSDELKNSTLNFKCLDGFSNSIDAGRLLNKDPEKSIAYIAIERSDDRWPDLNPKKSPGVTAGPFYLVWSRPDLSKISVEEWPYQLAGFEIKGRLADQFPKTAPKPSDLQKNSHLKIGYEKFMQNCFACHTMNGEGDAKIGPDLNTPHNPTEYLKADYLKTLIRNPQNLHHWPQSKMMAFNEEALSNSDLHDVILYLQYMSRHRKP